MTLKNTDDCFVYVQNRQTSDEGTDVIEESGRGSCRVKNGKVYLMYKSVCGGESQSTTIIADGSEIRIKRSGSASSDMTYIEGEKTYFKYHTPYGTMNMEIDTVRIRNCLSEDGGELTLVYRLNIQGESFYNDMKITAKRDL